MKLKKKALGLGAVALLAVGLAACGDDNDEAKKDTDDQADTPSEEAVGDSVDYEITGIDPGAGVMEATARAIEDYGLDEWTVTTSSDAAMTASLKKAYEKEEPIIATGWTPHWIFAEFDLKFLDDPEGSYGGAEDIHTIGRVGLEEDMPEAYAVLERFNWTQEDMAKVMVDVMEGEKVEVASQNWIDANADQVAEWTEGVEEVDGDKIKFVHVSWDTTVASTNVMKIVLEDLGYDVTMLQVELGPMWTSVADGSADVTLAGWLPLSHKTYAEKYEGEFDDIGTSIEDVRIGLMVPEYMDIDSIEDLKE